MGVTSEMPGEAALAFANRRKSEVSLIVPGALAGMEFDETAILEFLAETINRWDRRIEEVIRRALQDESHVSRLRGFVLWREVALLANEFCTANPEFRGGAGMFNSPFDGLLMNQLFSERDLVCLFCEFFYEHRKALLRYLKDQIAAGQPLLDLAESLLISEVVLAREGLGTELDSIVGNFEDPTAIQQQAWATRIASIETRYKPAAFAA